MPQERYVVLDVNIVVDLAFEIGGVHTGSRPALEKLLHVLGREVELRGEIVTLHPMLSDHIVDTAKVVLGRHFSDAQRDQLLTKAEEVFQRRGGAHDTTTENYRELAQKRWLRYGTDAEDEAIVACAERNGCAVITNDADLRQYCEDIRVAVWSLDSFVKETVKR